MYDDSNTLSHRSYDKYHGKSVRKRVYWQYEGSHSSLYINENKNKDSQIYDSEATKEHLYITAVDEIMRYKFIDGKLHKNKQWSTVVDVLEKNCIKKKSFVENRCQYTDYCLPIIGHIDRPKIYGDSYDIKTIRYFDDEHKGDQKYTVVYTVSFPKSIDDTIFYPVHCGKKCGICRDHEKPKGYMRRKTQSHLRQEVNDL